MRKDRMASIMGNKEFVKQENIVKKEFKARKTDLLKTKSMADTMKEMVEQQESLLEDLSKEVGNIGLKKK